MKKLAIVLVVIFLMAIIWAGCSNREALRTTEDYRNLSDDTEPVNATYNQQIMEFVQIWNNIAEPEITINKNNILIQRHNNIRTRYEYRFSDGHYILFNYNEEQNSIVTEIKKVGLEETERNKLIISWLTYITVIEGVDFIKAQEYLKKLGVNEETDWEDFLSEVEMESGQLVGVDAYNGYISFYIII